MDDSELLSLSVRIREYWPATSDDVGSRALEAVANSTFKIASTAIDELRNAMPDHHKVIEPNRLGAICKRLAGDAGGGEGAKAVIARTSAYLEHQRNQGAEAAALRAKLEAMHVSADDMQRGFDACAKEYDATWGGITNKAMLIKAYLKGGFPK